MGGGRAELANGRRGDDGGLAAVAVTVWGGARRGGTRADGACAAKSRKGRAGRAPCVCVWATPAVRSSSVYESLVPYFH